MLVLSRKKNESIVIDSTTKVEVVEIRGDKVRLGVQAPKEVSVHREEVWKAIHGKEFMVPTDDGIEAARSPRVMVRVKIKHGEECVGKPLAGSNRLKCVKVHTLHKEGEHEWVDLQFECEEKV